MLLQDQYPHHRIIWAVGLSILLHGMALLLIPRLKIDEVKQPETITVELATPQAAAPASEETAAPPEQPQPPEPPKPVPRNEPVTKPVKKPSLEKMPPAPTEPVETSQPVMTAPKTEAPAIVNTPAAPAVPTEQPAAPAPKPAGPSQRDLDNARNLYGNMLASAISKYKEYPRVAQMRGWEGQVDLEIEIDSNGNVLATRILQSSGREILDKQALEMVKKASPLPPPPDALRGRTFTVFVPIPFRLEN